MRKSFISFDTELIQRMTDDNFLRVIYVTRILLNFLPWQGVLSQDYRIFIVLCWQIMFVKHLLLDLVCSGHSGSHKTEHLK